MIRAIDLVVNKESPPRRFGERACTFFLCSYLSLAEQIRPPPNGHRSQALMTSNVLAHIAVKTLTKLHQSFRPEGMDNEPNQPKPIRLRAVSQGL
jgi:hypothetical protein